MRRADGQDVEEEEEEQPGRVPSVKTAIPGNGCLSCSLTFVQILRTESTGLPQAKASEKLEDAASDVHRDQAGRRYVYMNARCLVGLGARF